MHRGVRLAIFEADQRIRPSMRSPNLAVLVGVLVVGCGVEGPARIGDAYARDSNMVVKMNAMKPAIEAAGVEIAPWSVVSPTPSLRHVTEQATLFADDPSIIAVVGHAGSRDALLGAAVYNARGVPQVVPNATSSRLAEMGPWTFTLVPSDSIEGAFIARYALDSLGATRIGVLYVGDEYGIGLRDGVRGAMLRQGMDIVDAAVIPGDGCVNPVSRPVTQAIVQAALQRSRPDAVVVTTGSAHGWCVANVLHTASPGTWILFGDGMDGARRIPAGATEVVPSRVRGVEFWTPREDEATRAFVSQFQNTAHQVPDPSNALQFDAYMLLAAAVRHAGNDRRAVRRWLESLGRTRDPWPGITGPIAFDRPRTEILRMAGPGGGTP